MVLKYHKDDRYEANKASTHDRLVHEAIACALLIPMQERMAEFDVIGVDEGQFFPDIVEFCEAMANAGKIVIVAGLDGTFQRKPFGRILELIPLAEDVVKLNAVCMICQGDAAFSKRRGSEMEVELIGGSEKYMAVCRSCYHTEQRNF